MGEVDLELEEQLLLQKIAILRPQFYTMNFCWSSCIVECRLAQLLCRGPNLNPNRSQQEPKKELTSLTDPANLETQIESPLGDLASATSPESLHTPTARCLLASLDASNTTPEKLTDPRKAEGQDALRDIQEKPKQALEIEVDVAQHEAGP